MLQPDSGRDGDDQPKGRFKVAKVLHFADEDEKPESESEKPTTCTPTVNTTATASDEEVQDTFSSSSPPMSPSHTIRSYGYNTENLKTFGKNTHEALPHVDHYRNLMSAAANMEDINRRPTLSQLHGHESKESQLPRNASNVHLQQYVEQNGDLEQGTKDEETVKVATHKAIKFGWIQGVLVRCLLNIWGVMLFLRLSWVVGAAGIGLTSVIILLATVVTVITSLSMSAICTNGEVRGGGAYYMISRSLGPEFGGAIGLIFSVANAVAVAMYVVGFAETIRDIMKDFDSLIFDEVNDVRIIGIVTIIALLCVALIGMEWEARAQVVLLGLLIIAMLNLVIGTFIPPSVEKKSEGFHGYSGEIFIQNFGPSYPEGETFFSVFALFFPAATGILAGANISGDLENAQTAIPKGTLLAILISTVTYLLIGWLVGSVAVRDATGELVSELVFNVTCPSEGCQYGLLNSMQVMQLISGWGPLVTVGIVSATLSSALASLVSAPKVFQAVCKDGIFPGIHIFAKGYGPSEEPRRAYLLAFAIAIAFICIGDLNSIAPLISNFFLMAYLLINYACFDASLSKSPGWRPSFRFYSMWLSLFGAVVCLAVMFVINWWAALTTIVVVTALYMYVRHKRPDVNWGSSTQANVYKDALQSTLRLAMIDEHVKNYRPQVLVLTGLPSARPDLVDFASGITKNIGLMVCGQVIIEPNVEKHFRHFPRHRQIADWFRDRHVKSFHTYVVAPNLRHGVECLLQTCGMGKLRPNTLMVGFKSNWREDNPQAMEEYFHVIHAGFDARFGVGVLRSRNGFDISSVMAGNIAVMTPRGQDNSFPDDSPDNNPVSDVEFLPQSVSVDTLGASGDNIAISSISVRDNEGLEEAARLGKQRAPEVTEEVANGEQEHLLLKSVDQFRCLQKKGTIDVWWLFDDGGLTLLIPYILAQKSNWRNCELRVFTAGTKKQALTRDEKNMATLLSKFRIDYSQMEVIPSIGKSPHKDTVAEFNELISPLLLAEGESQEDKPWKITNNDLEANKARTDRHLRVRELLLEKSKDAKIIFVTLPIPRKGVCPAGLYMAWLDSLTKNMPPIMLLRGNQESVLTYYS